jgi:hypothetical protein
MRRRAGIAFVALEALIPPAHELRDALGRLGSTPSRRHVSTYRA